MAETFVHIWIATVEPQMVDEVLKQFREMAEQAPSRLHGFNGSSILLSDDRTRIVSISDWEAPHDWGRAQWQEYVQEGVARMFGSMKHLDSQTYREVFRIGKT